MERNIDDINRFLSTLFVDAKFEMVDQSEHTYQFKLIISKAEQNISIHKDEFNAHYRQHVFDWIEEAVRINWKRRRRK